MGSELKYAVPMFVLLAATAGCPKKDPGGRAVARGADARVVNKRSPRAAAELPESGPLAQKVLYEQAKGLLLAGRAAAAEPLFRRAIAAHGAGKLLANCYLGLGSALASLGRHGDAVAAYEEVVRLRPGDAEARRALAVGLEDAGRFEAARRALKQALVLDPLALSAYQDLATLQLKAEDRAGAHATYKTYEAKRLEVLGRLGGGGDVDGRLDALARLAEARDEKTARALVELLDKERRSELRVAMIRALASQGQGLAIEPLRALQGKAKSAAERQALVTALAVLGAPAPAPASRPAQP